MVKQFDIPVDSLVFLHFCPYTSESVQYKVELCFQRLRGERVTQEIYVYTYVQSCKCN